MRIVWAALLLAVVSTPAHAKLAELLITDAGVKKPVGLEGAIITADVDLAAARVTYDLTFVSTRAGTTEGTFYFALPRGSYVHEFGMYINGKYQGSAIVEAQAGRVAYESIVRRGVDPALLEWTAGNTFKMRVFPIVAQKKTRIQLTIGLPLAPVGGKLIGAFPLDLGKVEAFTFDVTGRAHADKLPKISGLKGLKLAETSDDDGIIAFKGGMKESDFLPPDEVRLEIKEDDPGKMQVRREDGDSDRFFEARVFPELDSKARPAPVKTLVFWDYSLSEEEHAEARIDVLWKYLLARKPQTVDVIGFNQKTFVVKEGLSGADPKAILTAIRRYPYDGGTRLDLLAQELGKAVAKDAGKVTDLVLFTNGVDSFELFDFKNVKGLGRKDLHAFIVTPTTGGNDALVQRFANALDAVVIDQDQDLSAKSFTTQPWLVTDVKGSKNLKDLEMPSQRSLYEGDGLVVRGQVKKDGKAELTVTFSQDGKTKTAKYALDTDVPIGKTRTVPRLWASQRINRLLPDKRKHTSEIRELALKHQLMSPFTVMVVLEFCEDYAEFKLEAPKDCPKRRDTERDGGDWQIFADEDSEGESEMEDSASEEASDDASAGGDSESMAADMAAPSPEMAMEMPASPAAKMAPSDNMFGDEDSEEGGEGEDEEGGSHNHYAVEKDTRPRHYGFEKELDEKAALGPDKLYAQYLTTRKLFSKIPFYYIYAADHFARLKRPDLADLVLSNVVEVRPGDARWLRIYAYSLIAWGKAKDSVPIYRSISELREEVGSSRVDLQACKLEYSIVSPK